MKEHDYVIPDNICVQAAACNQTDILEWDLSLGYEKTEDICIIAVVYKRFKIFEYAAKNGCPWDRDELLQYCNPDMIDEWNGIFDDYRRRN